MKSGIPSLDNKVTVLFRNVGNQIPCDRASHLRRTVTSPTPIWKPANSQQNYCLWGGSYSFKWYL